MKLVLASRNEHKLSEMRSILSGFGLEVVSQADVGFDLDVEETGTTFEENSEIKARALLEATGMPTIADDSGLMVDALDGAPGVYSHRFGNKNSDEERNDYLMELMDGIPAERRGAHYVSVITCLFPDGRKIVGKGICTGQILTEYRGHNGFGYDPMFLVDGTGKTFAELTAEEKNRISHRAKALADFSAKYQEVFCCDDK